MPTLAVRKDDPNVKLPDAVRATAAKAEQLHSEIYKKDEPAKDPTPPADPTPPPAEPKTEAAPKEPAPTPPKEVTPEVTPPAGPKDVNWEHAYKSMKGRHDRQVEANRAMLDRISNLEGTIASLQAAPPAPRAPSENAAPLLTDKERAEYGDEFLGVVEKKTKEVYGNEVETLRRQVADLTNRVQSTTQTVARTARDEMKATLTSDIPNWNEINHDDGFKAWLSLPEPFSGVIRHTLLKQAWDRNDSRRVLAFFKGFLAEEATGTPPSPTPDPTPSSTGGKVPLESLAAPGRAKTAADTGSPAEKPIITRAQIATFYAEKAAGKWRGREDAAKTFEESIWAAQKEGRIR